MNGWMIAGFLVLGIIGLVISFGCVLLCVNVTVSDKAWEKCYEEKFGDK